MKKWIYLSLIASLFLLAPQVHAGHMKGAMDGKMCPMGGSACKVQMVSSNDGGVIILAGHKLYKYDKNLNLVKEAQIETGMDSMKKLCPMCEGMKDKDGKKMCAMCSKMKGEEGEKKEDKDSGHDHGQH